MEHLCGSEFVAHELQNGCLEGEMHKEWGRDEGDALHLLLSVTTNLEQQPQMKPGSVQD